MNKQELNKKIAKHCGVTSEHIDFTTYYIPIREAIGRENRKNTKFYIRYLDCLQVLVGCKPNGFESIFESKWKVHTASVFKMAIAFAFAVNLIKDNAELLLLQQLADEEDN